MKIVFLSDTHDNLPNFKKVIGWAEDKGIKTVVHCGDVSSPATWKKALEGFRGKAFVSLGNADEGFNWEREKRRDPHLQESVFTSHGRIELGGVRIGFCHLPRKARELAENENFDVVFYGHTHKPWEEKVVKTAMINPGNVAGIKYQPTFGVYDTEKKKAELKILRRLEDV